MNMETKLYNGDCLEEMKKIPDGSVDAIVTDPPYELGFMGKAWDSTGIANNVEMWKECLRVLKPGGHLLAFSGTRTYHRMASAIEDAGFEVRDMIEWVYGSGFPKSLNIAKAIQKNEGIALEDTGVISPISRPNVTNDLYKSGKVGKNFTIKNVTTDNAKQWEGWGTALKPAHEPICMARKPIESKTVAENCLKWGTGGINIDESRVDGKTEIHSNGKRSMYGGNSLLESKTHNDKTEVKDYGRFPANLIHDNSEEVKECFPETGKQTRRLMTTKDATSIFNQGTGDEYTNYRGYDDNGGNASRFFKSIIYQSKASKKDRGLGNTHATVKPTTLMEYLIKMVTRENTVVLDPFMGSGTTGVAAKSLNRNFVGIELEPEYFEIAKKRIEEATIQLALNSSNQK